MPEPIRVGAVIYDPKVVVIWQVIKEFFETSGCPMDTVFYKDYDLQVGGLVNGDIDIAWNSPLAWLDSQRRTGGACRAIAMRDTDQDRTTRILVRADSTVHDLGGMKGRVLATGAKDSPQSTLIPTALLHRHGLEPGRDFEVRRFDIGVGLHGDHIGGELDALKSLQNGESDAAAVLDLNWNLWASDGTADASKIEPIASTDRFDHCVFTARPGFNQTDEKRWLDVLYTMSYDNPAHREMMDTEGLKAWLPGRTSGFAALADAVDRLGFFE